MVKMKDVAERAGVSAATVSNVFTGKHYVSPEVKERVMKAVEELDYHINFNARGLKTSKTKTIGVVLPDMTKLFFNEVMRGILETAEEVGYRIVVLSSYFDFSIEKDCISTLRSSNVDAIILDSCCDYHDLRSWAAELSSFNKLTPVVFIENSMDESLVSSVTIDSYYWSNKVTRYLISKGRKKILFISGPAHLRQEHDRLSGYKQALKDYNIRFSEELVLSSDYSTDSSYDMVMNLLKSKSGPKFDAVQASNDEAGIGALKALMDYGIKIPKEVSVCGFDNLFPSTLVTPSLTTVSVPRREIGSEAVNECIHHIKDPSLPYRNIVLSAQLIERGSTEENASTPWDLVYW